MTLVPGQNVYDDEAFFNGYQRMRGAAAGLNEALEQPALRSLLPRLSGLDVVDLGCGDGWLSRELAEHGARTVLGVDPSARMLELARARTDDVRVEFRRAFAEDLQLPACAADLIVSSLALHYVQDMAQVLQQIATWLRPGGVLVTSMEHPVVTASASSACEHGWAVADYAEEGVRHTAWYIPGVVKYHRTVSAIISNVLAAGLVLTALLEPSPTTAAVHDRPDLALHRQRPPLLVIRAQRPMPGEESS